MSRHEKVVEPQSMTEVASQERKDLYWLYDLIFATFLDLFDMIT